MYEAVECIGEGYCSPSSQRFCIDTSHCLGRRVRGMSAYAFLRELAGVSSACTALRRKSVFATSRWDGQNRQPLELAYFSVPRPTPIFDNPHHLAQNFDFCKLTNPNDNTDCNRRHDTGTLPTLGTSSTRSRPALRYRDHPVHAPSQPAHTWRTCRHTRVPRLHDTNAFYLGQLKGGHDADGLDTVLRLRTLQEKNRG